MSTSAGPEERARAMVRTSGASQGAGHRARLLHGLTDSQRAVVVAEDEPLCVLAGAGSGKTTVLTRRVARRVLDASADPARTLVVTFTRRAAAELQERLRTIGIPGAVWAGTLHAAAYGQLRRHWADRSRRPPGILDDPIRLLRVVVAARGLPPDARSRRAQPGLLACVAGEIHWARARLVAPEAYPDAARLVRRPVSPSPEWIAQVYASYGEEKRRRGVVDLDDLIDLSASILEDDEEEAAACRWRIRHLFVDEFQDLNPAQWRLLRLWLGQRTDLFVVGDPLQAVYGWNGADPTLIDRLPRLLPGTTVLRLDHNHRSTPRIVATASALFRGNPDDGRAESAAAAGRPHACPRPDGPLPTVAGFDSDEAEATSLCRWLRRAHPPGRSWSQLAVLARTNARLEPVAAALGRAGIPHRLPRASHGHAAMRRALALLRAAPARQALRGALAEAVVSLPTHGGHRAPEHDGVPEDLWPLPPQLWRLVEEHASEEPGATVGEFLAWLTTSGMDEEDTSGDGASDRVELTTFHKAKGLEWRAVAVVGLEDGVVPIAHATTDDEIAEERRLLYVALTRAEEELWCSWASTRGEEHVSWRSSPSPFLALIEPAIEDPESGADIGSRRAHLSELRARLLAV